MLAQDEAMFRRLSGWQAFMSGIHRIANETLGFLQLWRKSIQKVEGKHGKNGSIGICTFYCANMGFIDSHDPNRS